MLLSSLRYTVETSWLIREELVLDHQFSPLFSRLQSLQYSHSSIMSPITRIDAWNFHQKTKAIPGISRERALARPDSKKFVRGINDVIYARLVISVVPNVVVEKY